MIIVDKVYTIEFSFAGVVQEARFNECEGVLVRPSLFVNWSKVGEIPDVSQLKTIDEVLEVIKTFSRYVNIKLINGQPVFYYEKHKETNVFIKSLKDAHEKYVDEQLTIFFNTYLVPLLEKNKWFISRSHIGYYVLVANNEKGEIDNIPNGEDETEFEYLCAKVLKALSVIDTIKPEREWVSHKLFNNVNDLEKSKFYLVD